jgi:hypothetical protein
VDNIELIFAPSVKSVELGTCANGFTKLNQIRKVNIAIAAPRHVSRTGLDANVGP